ncbi:MAG TPA: hypothetical protein VD887_07910 [Allosphingosinicella sp.]|nr:hypothetical protein [Allosphingosinicella sp.]
MLTALLLAALQAAPPAADRRAADLVTAWTLCLNDAADADAARGLASAEAASAAAERALAACAREEAAIRAELVRRRGAAQAGPVVAGFRGRAREMLGRRLEPSVGPAADPVMAASRAFAACTGTHVASGALGSADAPSAIVERALARCAPHESRIRAAVIARGAPAADADAFVQALRANTRDSGPGLVEQVRAQAAARR